MGIVCLCHAIGDRRYFLAPCDKREHTGHAQQQAARIPLGDTLCDYRTVVSVSSAL